MLLSDFDWKLHSMMVLGFTMLLGRSQHVWHPIACLLGVAIIMHGIQ
jgi:hypothetical protein